MKKGILFALIALFFFGSCSEEAAQTTKSSVPAKEFFELIQADANGTILDVRTAGEFEKGHLAKAINIDVNGSSFKQDATQLDKSKTVYVYCLSGGRSATAADYLRKTGYQVVEMQGGMTAWNAAKLPVEKTQPAFAAGMTMDQYTQATTKDKLVLVDFNAVWCAPCKKLAPILEELATTHSEKMELLKIDADQNSELASALQVTGLPTLMLYKNGKVVWKKLGYTERSEIEKAITDNL